MTASVRRPRRGGGGSATSKSATAIVSTRKLQGGPQIMTIILSIVNRFKNFFTERFLCIFAVKLISKIPPHVVYVATLPCKALMSAKQLFNDKLQGSVVIYLRCGGVVNK